MCNKNSDSKCIADILKVINILQNNAECPDQCLDTCDRGFLGNTVASMGLNTRPVMLYTCCSNGITPWTMPTSKNNVTCNDDSCSSVFRVEKIDDNCATFRVLAVNTDPATSAAYPYLSTNSFFTMNLNCVCALRCLNDITVECL